MQLTTNKNILCVPISGFEIDISADLSLKLKILNITAGCPLTFKPKLKFNFCYATLCKRFWQVSFIFLQI